MPGTDHGGGCRAAFTSYTRGTGRNYHHPGVRRFGSIATLSGSIRAGCHKGRHWGIKVETVLDEIAKLKQLRALGLPEVLFRNVPAKLVNHYRQRAASEKPRELRRHPPEVRYTLLAALCWQREREITDTLVELLIHIAHRVGVRAEEEKVEIELIKYVKKVMGKARLLYKLAKAAKGQPDGLVRNVIYPVVSEATLDDLIREAEAGENHEHQVKLVARASYSHHYRPTTAASYPSCWRRFPSSATTTCTAL
jgi:hypothetical protein